MALRELGIETKFVALGDAGTPTVRPLILATLEQMKDERWWRQHEASGVIIFSWGAPRFEPIVRAVKASGARVVVHLDSDGFSSPHVSFRDYWFGTYVEFRDRRKLLPVFSAFAKTLLFWSVPRVYDLRVQQHLSQADIVTVNSPIGAQRIRRLLLRFNRPDLAAKLRQIPAPSRADCGYDASVKKQPQIVAVGRWNAYQKDAPMLISVLDRFLQQRPDYRVVIIGVGGDRLRRLIRTRVRQGAERIMIRDFVDRQELLRIYQESQIIFVPSRAESLHLAAAEALCCGCSVVGHVMISSLQWFAGRASGTLAPRRTTADFTDALLAEAEAWKNGDRNPTVISADWRSRMLDTVCARKILAEVEALEAPPTDQAS